MGCHPLELGAIISLGGSFSKVYPISETSEMKVSQLSGGDRCISSLEVGNLEKHDRQYPAN